jgi:hypothetical protein
MSAKESAEAVDSVPAAHPIPDGHSANRSLSAIEPVSATAKRKLENGEQRLAPETRPLRAEMPQIAGQRLGRAGVTRGNVADSHTPGNNTPETRLPGCPERIRTLESKDAWQTLGLSAALGGGKRTP